MSASGVGRKKEKRLVKKNPPLAMICGSCRGYGMSTDEGETYE